MHVGDGIEIYCEHGFGWVAWRWCWTSDAGDVYLGRSMPTYDAAYQDAEDAIAAIKSGKAVIVDGDSQSAD